ncbi:hypothetical protein HED49_11670 [Ochrobactrum daejeonense]|nr:hypothetical protein [Brucella daejeonensis]
MALDTKNYTMLQFGDYRPIASTMREQEIDPGLSMLLTPLRETVSAT